MSDKPILKSLRVKTMLEATMGAINTERKGGETSIEQVPETGQIMLHIHKHPEGDVKTRDRNAAPEFKNMDALPDLGYKTRTDMGVNRETGEPRIRSKQPKPAPLPEPPDTPRQQMEDAAEEAKADAAEAAWDALPEHKSNLDDDREFEKMKARGESPGEPTPHETDVSDPINQQLQAVGAFDATPEQIVQFAEMLGIPSPDFVNSPRLLASAITTHGAGNALLQIMERHGLQPRPVAPPKAIPPVAGSTGNPAVRPIPQAKSQTAGGMIGDFAKGFTQGSGLGMARNVAGRTARNAIRGATGMRFSAAAALYAADFDEAKHPRDEAGKFSEAHKNTGKKPPVEKLKDAMIDAGVMRENDRGRKSFVDAAIKALPANKWLTGYQVAKKAWNVNTAEARQGIIKAVKDLCKAGQVEKRWDDDGQVLYAWKGTDPTPGLLTEQEASEKWPNDPQEKKQSYGEKEVERLQSPAAGDPGEPPLQPGDTLRTWRKMRYQNPGYVQSDKEVSRTIETIERGKRLKDPDKWKVKFKGNETWFILNAKTGVIRAMNAARTQYDTDAAEKNDSQDESPAGEKKKQGGIVMPTGEIDNEDAKGGDQLGLFEGTGKKKKLATKYKQDNPQGKARAKTLFDKDEDPDQQTLFGSFGEAVEYYAADLKKK